MNTLSPTHDPMPYNAIYLSPHLDDATLSCGAQIFDATRRGERVLVVTIMAGDAQTVISDYAQSLQARWELPQDAAAGRRAEDLAACAILGAEALHWAIPDCIYRVDPGSNAPLYLSDQDIFGDVHTAERALVDELTALLHTLPAGDRVIAPLTIGHHVDHLLVRTAAARVWGDDLLLYEDYPYAQDAARKQHALASEPSPLTAKSVAVSPEALRAKIRAVLAYRSQISTFWTDQSDLEAQVFGYAAQVGGERLWAKQNGG